jgi:hypothetical protein
MRGIGGAGGTGAGMVAVRWRRMATLALLGALAAIDCGGGGGGGGGGHVAPGRFACSDAAVMPDRVALACGMAVSDDVWALQLVIGGPTTATSIAGFNLDVLFDPAVYAYVPGSVVAGPLLQQGGNSPLAAASIESGDPGRLLIGIHRSPVDGVGGAGPVDLVLTFEMRALNRLARSGPTLLRFDHAEAVDPSDTPIASIGFSDQLLLSIE